MTEPPVHIVGDEPDANVYDLDAYRKMRELRGDWPPTREDQFKFFYRWRQDRKNGKV